MFFIQKLVNNNSFKNNHITILWNVLQVIGVADTLWSVHILYVTPIC